MRSLYLRKELNVNFAFSRHKKELNEKFIFTQGHRSGNCCFCLEQVSVCKMQTDVFSPKRKLFSKLKTLLFFKQKGYFCHKFGYWSPTCSFIKRLGNICSQDLFKEEARWAALASHCLSGLLMLSLSHSLSGLLICLLQGKPLASCLLPGREEELEDWLEQLGNVAVQASVQNLSFGFFFLKFGILPTCPWKQGAREQVESFPVKPPCS